MNRAIESIADHADHRGPVWPPAWLRDEPLTKSVDFDFEVTLPAIPSRIADSETDTAETDEPYSRTETLAVDQLYVNSVLDACADLKSWDEFVILLNRVDVDQINNATKTACRTLIERRILNASPPSDVVVFCHDERGRIRESAPGVNLPHDAVACTWEGASHWVRLSAKRF